MIRRIIRRVAEVIRQEIAWYELRKERGTHRPSVTTDFRMMRGAR